MSPIERLGRMASDAVALTTPEATSHDPIAPLITRADRPWVHATIALLEEKLAVLREWYPIERDGRVTDRWHKGSS